MQSLCRRLQSLQFIKTRYFSNDTITALPVSVPNRFTKVMPERTAEEEQMRLAIRRVKLGPNAVAAPSNKVVSGRKPTLRARHLQLYAEQVRKLRAEHYKKVVRPEQIKEKERDREVAMQRYKIQLEKSEKSVDRQVRELVRQRLHPGPNHQPKRSEEKNKILETRRESLRQVQHQWQKAKNHAILSILASADTKTLDTESRPSTWITRDNLDAHIAHALKTPTPISIPVGNVVECAVKARDMIEQPLKQLNEQRRTARQRIEEACDVAMQRTRGTVLANAL